MTKILKVIKPFMMMEVGDTMELSENGTYVSSYTDKYDSSSADDANANVYASFTGKCEISADYAAQLIDGGFLMAESDNTPFVNVFDEIDHLREMYKQDFDELFSEENAEMPACMRVEKETVLRNMIKVLDHLKSLKK